MSSYKDITIADRVAFAIWLISNMADFFRAWPTEGDYYHWANGELRPFCETLYGAGRIEADHLGSVIVLTVDAAASQRYHRIGKRDPVLTALGEGNNAGKNVREIGLANVPLFYQHDHNATYGIITGSLRAFLFDRDGEVAQQILGQFQGHDLADALPWTMGPGNQARIRDGYELPEVLRLIAHRNIGQGLANSLVAQDDAELQLDPKTVNNRLDRIEGHLGL